MTDPSAIKSLAITSDDIVTAVAATERNRENVVLRVTPPYSGRMRARLHVVQPTETADETIHIPPEKLLSPDAPEVPSTDETADELRESADDSYSVERHRRYHDQRLEEWRETLPEYIVDRIYLPQVGHEVAISLLGA